VHPFKRSTVVAWVAVALLRGAAAWADEPATAPSAGNAPEPGLWTRDTLLGDMGGLRPVLEDKGITLGLQETDEYLRVTSGSLRQGGTYLGQTLATLNIDTGKALGLKGGTFFMSGLQLHGHKDTLTGAHIGGLQTASSIEAERGTRLWELWYQQAFAGDKADVRVGQQAADQEFMVSEYGTPFINAMFGWPALPSVDLPGGGPAYPLSLLGLRVRYQAGDRVTLLGGIYNGRPAGRRADDDAQQGDRHGTNFRLGDAPLLIAELQYRTHPVPAQGEPDGLPGSYKVGAWIHTGRFADSSDPSRMHRGDYSLYAMADQMLWRATAGHRSVAVFARAMGAPANRNLVDFSADAGITLTAPFGDRAGDVLGLGIGYARISNPAALQRHGGGETFVEATYKVQIAPWWSLQADAQYYVHPSGTSSALPLRNAVILGLRTTLTF
jgi:porin